MGDNNRQQQQPQTSPADQQQNKQRQDQQGFPRVDTDGDGKTRDVNDRSPNHEGNPPS